MSAQDGARNGRVLVVLSASKFCERSTEPFEAVL